ncbi:MAG: MmcQ/YjbR family DNA-binding protein [Candidatus Symbiothrix sp.]|jgi:predicted DNA-binding protein (MmcQ/YjbR family)|nr:MmcQ/YjbR family DNA-binding protein [Candidatus Symbiothrix sp.]
MNIEKLRECCLAVKGVEECMPFNDDTPVYKVMGKMFAYFGLTPKDGKFVVSLKCDPERSAALRDKYSGVGKPIHSADTLKWNSVYIESDVPDSVIAELVAHSADEVIKALPRYKREEYRKTAD